MKDKLKRLLILIMAFMLAVPIQVFASIPGWSDGFVDKYWVWYDGTAYGLKWKDNKLVNNKNLMDYAIVVNPPDNDFEHFYLTTAESSLRNRDGWRISHDANKAVEKDMSVSDESWAVNTTWIDTQMVMLDLYMSKIGTNYDTVWSVTTTSPFQMTGSQLLVKMLPIFLADTLPTSDADVESGEFTVENIERYNERVRNGTYPYKEFNDYLAGLNSVYPGFSEDDFVTNVLGGDATLENLEDKWEDAASSVMSMQSDNAVTIRQYLQYFLVVSRAPGQVASESDERQDATNTGPSGVGSDTSIGGLTNQQWNNWYIAASKVARGVSPTSPEFGMDAEYSSAANLLGTSPAIRDREDFYRIAYDVMCVAYSRGPSNELSEWDAGEAALNGIYEEVKLRSNGRGLDPNGVTRYAATLGELNSLASSAPDDLTRRLTSFYDRITALYHVSTLVDVDFDATAYQWIPTYYEADNNNLKIPDWAFTSDANVEQFMSFNGTRYKDFPALGNNPKVLPYLLQTVWEIPYIMEYKAKDFNEAIANSTISSQQSMYEGLVGIKNAVDELGIPILTKMWEAELAPDETFKSLKAMYEACQNDPTIKAQQAELKTDLGTGLPLSGFMADFATGPLSDYYIKSIAYTSTLVPMRSNVYSEEWRSYLEADLRENFYDLWGFNRKALYMDKTSGAGQEYYTSNKTSRGDLRVCTLRDLLESKDDIVLYLDDNFYNAESLRTNLTINPAYSPNEEETSEEEETVWYYNMASSIEDTFNTSFDNIVKTGPSTNYSKTFYDMMSKVKDTHTYYPEATELNPGNKDNIVLNSGKINYYLKAGETGSEIYSPLQSYAVVSSIYRNGNLFTVANSAEKQRPVFVSSKSAPYAKGASNEQKMVIYNYALLKNLEASMPVGYTGNLDMDCPLYMDILGNILTESGTVVVPALSNATIMNHSSYYKSVWSAGLFSIYGMDYRIPVKQNDAETIGPVLEGVFEQDSSGKYYTPIPRTLGDDYNVDMSRLSSTSKDTMSVLFERAYNDLLGKNTLREPLYDYDSYFQICLEVLRGAPIENINKEQEGLDTSDRVDRAGIVAAAKLEELNKALGTNGENTSLSLPNLAFMKGFNYIALIAFKLLLIAVILINMVTVYYDAVSESLSLRTFFKCLWALVLTMATIITVPAVFNVTYYQSNRALLQDETSYISMLNLEKEESGVEIGVTEIKEPDINTELFIKLESIKIPWYDLFYNSIRTDSYKTLNAMYEDYAANHTSIGYRDDVLIKNDGVYVDVSDVYSSSSVDMNMSTSDANVVTLVQTAATDGATFSYYSPYYAILDGLIQNVNYFNANPWGENETNTGNTQGWYSYTTKSQKGGKLKTMGLIEPYFTSSKFMESEGADPLGLKAIYSDLSSGIYEPDPATANFYSSSNLIAMRNSYWYPDGMSEIEVNKRLDYMTKQARLFVANNKDLLGKISDETFLKVMAMDLALKHNRILGCEYGSTYEISNLSSDDLIRLSVADRGDVMINSSLSYPRFIYTVGGSPTVFASALLSMIMWISGLLKPALVILAFLVIFASIFIFKICARKEDTSLYGYVITVGLLCLTNIAYSLLLKVSLYLPAMGLTPFMCVIFQIILQIVYLVILLSVVSTAFRDWRDLGYARYANRAQDLKVGFIQSIRKGKNISNPNFEGSSRKSDPEKNWNYYDEMLEERKRRSR